MIRTPSIVVTTEPRPPMRLVPPMTTAAIAWSSRPAPALGSAAARRALCAIAATALASPARRKVAKRIGRGSMPESHENRHRQSGDHGCVDDLHGRADVFRLRGGDQVRAATCDLQHPERDDER